MSQIKTFFLEKLTSYLQYIADKDVKELSKLTLENVEPFSLKGQTLRCKCCKVYDGDTVTLIFPIKITQKIFVPITFTKYYRSSCRLYGMDAPEIKTNNPKEKEAAIKSRDFLANLILGQIITATFYREEKYGRLLADLYISEYEDTSLNQILVEKGHAYSYTGKTKVSFDDWYQLDK